MSQEHIEPIEYYKETWGDGPWMQEPDRKQWQHAGYACLIVRNHMGALCGYVGIPEDHPDFEADCMNVDISAHGGVNYCGFGPVCYVPEPGMPDNVWWFGFDCGHPPIDFLPVLHGMLGDMPIVLPSGKYRDIAYVTQEVEDLADQLRERQHA
jgi:hypothetical protein